MATRHPLPYAFAREHLWLLEEEGDQLTLHGSSTPATDSVTISSISVKPRAAARATRPAGAPLAWVLMACSSLPGS